MNADVCYANIGPRGIRLRQIGGVIAGLVAIGLVIAMIALHQPRTYRILAFAPFWLSALGFLQAREKTCVGLASRGMRDLDGGAERVEDGAEQAALAAQAGRVRLLAMAAAAALTAATFLIP